MINALRFGHAGAALNEQFILATDMHTSATSCSASMTAHVHVLSLSDGEAPGVSARGSR